MVKDRKSVILVLIFVIYSASSCIYYGIAARYRDPKQTSFVETAKKYGYRDFHSMNTRGKIFYIFLMLFILVVRLYLISNISNMIDFVVNSTSGTRKLSNPDLLNTLMEFGDNAALPAAVSQDNAESSRQRGYGEGSFHSAIQQELTPEIHEIELRVYHCFIEALNESRLPLRCELKLLLKLQNVLHISHDEHLMVLRSACPFEN